MKRKFLVFLVLLTGILAWFVHFYVPKFIVEIKNPIIETARVNFYDSHANPKPLNNFENIVYKGVGDIHLDANFFQSKTQPAKATVILVHGIRSNKEENTPVAQWLIQNGYNAVAVDLRAHGESEGDYCTFGYYEKQDISKLIDFLIHTKNIRTPIGIWGHSLGAAISLQAMATDKRIAFGIIESTYADFEQITRDYGKHYSSIESDFLNEYMLERAGEIAGFDVKAVNPIDYVCKISQPVLLVHGKNDKKIKWQYSEQIFDKLPGHNVEFMLMNNAGHNNIHSIGGKGYFYRVSVFMRKALS